MISLSDFKEKQILVVQADFGDKVFLRINNENIAFYKNGKLENQLPCCKVFCVFILGNIAISSYLLKSAATHGISVFFMKYNFEVYSSLNSFLSGNYFLRDRQYSQDKFCEMKIAKHLVKNKIKNQYALLKEKADKDLDINTKLEILEKKIFTANDKELLGIEGNATKIFFKSYFNANDINWHKRSPRSKYDIYNLLMDMGYTFLFNFIDAVLSLYGFDTYKGVYHKLFFQRKSLSCDIMEPFRCLIDKQIVKSYNLKQIDENDFAVKNGRYYLKMEHHKKYAEIFIKVILKNKEDIFIFVRDFYKYFVREGAMELPKFNINKKI